MGMDTTFVKGKPTGLYVSDAFPVGTKASKPTPVTLIVGVDAAAAATSVTLKVAAGTVDLKKGQILVFNEGDPDEVTCVVGADATVDVTGVAVTVGPVEGEASEGLPGALVATDEADWDRMYRVMGTSRAPLNVSEGTNQLSSVTYDSASAMSWDETETQSKNWNLSREGNFKPHDHAFNQCELAAFEGRELWLQRILPDEAGAAAKLIEGRVTVQSWSDDPPADGLITASWTFQGQGKPTRSNLP